MDDLLLQPNEILALIAEVGNSIQICDYSVTAVARPEFGFPEQREMVCRPIRGYVTPLVQGYGTPQLSSQLTLESGSLQLGNYVAYISAEDLRLDQLHEGTVLLWNNVTYQAKYLRGIQHRGVVLLHEIVLNQTQKQQIDH
jgi:hypothetical protein